MRDMLARVKRNRIILVAVLALLAASCNGSEEAAAPSPSLAPSPTVAPPASPSGTVVGDCKIEPKTQCPGAYLSLVSLAGMDLSGANLEGADLSKSDLRKVELTGANLAKADIRDSDLTDATLVGADLVGAKLKHANLTRADFTGATVAIGQLSSAYLCNTVMPNGTKNDSGCEIPTASPTQSASPQAGPTITSFIAPEGAPPCPASPPDASVTVKIRYKTTGADTVTFLIDGEDPGAQAGLKTSGSASLDFTCDKPSHRYTLIADGDGKKVKQTATVYRT